MNISTDKRQIRQTILAAREQLSLELRAEYNAAITERLLQLPEYLKADTVLGYMNFGNEFASELWVAQVLSEGKRLALPRVNRHTNLLELYWVTDLKNQLAAGLWGIREPVVARCERLNAINEVEFVLLPGVAFTREGARLGYGGGFYDKLLSCGSEQSRASRPALVAAAFAVQIVEQIPQEKTDVKVGWIITEQETIICSEQVKSRN